MFYFVFAYYKEHLYQCVICEGSVVSKAVQQRISEGEFQFGREIQYTLREVQRKMSNFPSWDQTSQVAYVILLRFPDALLLSVTAAFTSDPSAHAQLSLMKKLSLLSLACYRHASGTSLITYQSSTLSANIRPASLLDYP